MVVDYVFDPIRCRRYKRLMNTSPYCNVWRFQFSSSDKVGNNSWLFNHLSPTDYFDFYRKYTEDGNRPCDDPRERGRNLWDLYELAERYRDACKAVEEQRASEVPIVSNNPIEFFIDNILLHVIVETFDGKAAEQQLIDYVESLNDGWHCKIVEGSKDALYGIDIAVCDENGVELHYVQVKPCSFFRGDCSHNESLLKDRVNAFDKLQLAKQRFGKETYFAVYNIDTANGEIRWYINEHDGLLFRLSQLLNTDGSINTPLSDFELRKFFFENKDC